MADRAAMLENAIYSVISPEGCASIMWKDATKKQQAADALKYTAYSVKSLGCVDDVLGEPEGGTHNDPALAMALVDERLRFHLAESSTPNRWSRCWKSATRSSATSRSSIPPPSSTDGKRTSGAKAPIQKKLFRHPFDFAQDRL